MRRYYMVSGILLILSIIDSALAAPLLLVREKSQPCVDAVMLNIPKDVTTVLAKRGGQEDLEMLVEKYMKKVADSESSAPPIPDWSTVVPQAPPVNLKHLMNIDYDPPPAPVGPRPPAKPIFTGPKKEVLDFTNPPKPKKSKPTNEKYWGASTGLGYYDPSVLDFTAPKVPKKPKPTVQPGSKAWSSTSLGDLLPQMEPPKDVGQAHESQHGQQEELSKSGEKPEESAGAHTASSSSAPLEPDHGSTNVPPLNWNYLDYPPPGAPARPSSSKGPGTGKHLANVDFPPKPAAPEMSGQQAAHPMLPENMLPPNSEPTDEPGEKYWSSMSLGDLRPEIEPPKGVGQAHESQYGQQPNAGPGPSDTGPSNSRPATTVDFLGVNWPLPPPTDSERATMGYRPPSPPPEPDLWNPPTLTPTEADSYYPGWVVYSPPPGTWSPTIPEHGMGTPPHSQAEQPSTPWWLTDPKL